MPCSESLGVLLLLSLLLSIIAMLYPPLLLENVYRGGTDVDLFKFCAKEARLLLCESSSTAMLLCSLVAIVG